MVLDVLFQHEEEVELPERCQELFEQFNREKAKNYKHIWWDTRRCWRSSKIRRSRYRHCWRDGTCWKELDCRGGRTPRWKHFPKSSELQKHSPNEATISSNLIISGVENADWDGCNGAFHSFHQALGWSSCLRSPTNRDAVASRRRSITSIASITPMHSSQVSRHSLNLDTAPFIDRLRLLSRHRQYLLQLPLSFLWLLKAQGFSCCKTLREQANLLHYDTNMHPTGIEPWPMLQKKACFAARAQCVPWTKSDSANPLPSKGTFKIWSLTPATCWVQTFFFVLQPI